jgi:hypothetical protein
MAAAAAKLGKILDQSTVTAMAKAAGMAAKTEGLQAASASLGGDRRMSGWRGGALNVGFDVAGSSVTVNYRPAGPWKLAETGRRKSKTVRKRGVIFRTPYGPRWSFRSTPSHGLRTLTAAKQGAVLRAPKAADDALQNAIRRVL